MKRFIILVLIVAALIIGYLLGASGTGRTGSSDLSLQDIRATTAVRTALALNKHLDGTGITVDVRDGQAGLGGTVRTEDQLRLAEAIASSIEGIEAVHNDIAIQPGSGPAPGDARARSLGERLDDLTTAARVRTALSLHRDIDRGDVDVSLHKGTTTLTGTVPSWAARELAGKVAEDVEGVRYLDNQLVVEPDVHIEIARPEGDMPSRAPRNTDGLSVPQQLTDSAVQLQIEAALRMKPQIDARRVHVEVMNSVAHLSGTVANEAERSLIEKVTEDCWGVTRVINDITHTPAAPPSTSSVSGEDLAPLLPGS